MSEFDNTSNIPYGYCQCGCGQKTNLSTHTHNGIKKGSPQLYLPSHNRRRNIPLTYRFWSKIAVTANPNECWIWQAGTISTGYGEFVINGTIQLAHRFAWELIKGKIPDKLCVLHNCPDGDNPLCCNPNHLFLGTRTDNMVDKVKKHRQTRGEQISSHKLTWDKVRTIRTAYSLGGITQSSLAREYGVSPSVIGAIVNGEAWIDR